MKKLPKKQGYCAPLALKYLSRRPDKEVYEVCSDNDFDPEYGMSEHEFLRSARELGIKRRRVNLKTSKLYRAKLKKLIKKYPRDTFLVYTDAHLFVVDRGRVIDPLNETSPGLKRLVIDAWRIYRS